MRIVKKSDFSKTNISGRFSCEFPTIFCYLPGSGSTFGFAEMKRIRPDRDPQHWTVNKIKVQKCKQSGHEFTNFTYFVPLSILLQFEMFFMDVNVYSTKGWSIIILG